MTPRGSHPAPIPARRARCGFTLLELMIGMIVTSLVAGAAAAMLSAVAQGWTHSGAADSSSNATVQTHMRVQRTLKSVRQVGAFRVGAVDGNAAQPAAMMLWKSDANSDNKLQFSELALLEHDPGSGSGSGTITYYDVAYPSYWSEAQRTAADTPALADDEIYNDANIDTFKNLAHVRATVVAANVVGAEFRRMDGPSTIRPAVEYLITFQKDGVTELEYGTAAVRTPTTLPTSQRGP